MSKISDKYAQLKSHNLDLGNDLHPGAPDMDAGYGGVYRQYAGGNIYYHPVMGDSAREVHGGILALYIKHGGPGIDPVSGKRLFGFPLSDETKASPAPVPFSIFETGAIYWTPGTGGCVLSGSAYQHYKEGRELTGGLAGVFHLFDHAYGLPLSSNMPVAGGEAIYCERGVVWATNAIPNGYLFGELRPPLLGNPLIFDPTPPPAQTVMDPGLRSVGGQPTMPANLGGTASATPGNLGPGGAGPINQGVVGHAVLHDFLVYQDVPRDRFDALMRWRPTLLFDLWNGRLSLVNTGRRDVRIPLTPVVASITPATVNTPVTAKCDLQLSPNAPATTPLSTLFDLEVATTNPQPYCAVSPHCLYTRAAWKDFGLLHITDLHLSKRNEQFRQTLLSCGRDIAAREYANTREALRDFIRYANHLHAAGLADAVVATGDLVDFIIEAGDDPFSGNFARLRRMILGQPFDDGVPAGEELLLPIFTTFGNHDYRVNPYDLICRINILHGVNKRLDNFGTYNLTAGEAKDIQCKLISHSDDYPEYGLGIIGPGIKDAIQFLKEGTESDFAYFTKYFGPRTYKVSFGPHRLVVIDTGGDAGIPKLDDTGDIASFFYNYLAGDLPGDTTEVLNGGAPNSLGFKPDDINLVRQAVNEAGQSGLVILGIHLPPLAPKQAYQYYLRETEHPTTDPNLTKNYVNQNGLAKDGWSYSGTPYFKTGDIVKSFDFGIPTTNTLDFLKACAGVGLARPIDLLLCGHHHDRVEYRVRWDAGAGQMQYFMDFYTENPPNYFASVICDPSDRDKNRKIHLNVVPNAPYNARPAIAHGTFDNQPATYELLTIPAYLTPLSSAADPAAWWQQHRPILAQTAALGPSDPCQRFNDNTVPDPVMQGFRVLTIRNNVIKKVRYIHIEDMRNANFVLPWEKEDTLLHVITGVFNPVNIGTVLSQGH